ncbi:MAG: EpsG family protein [Prevotella sp.]|nr:EpsG family protein [Prevotella sp.]
MTDDTVYKNRATIVSVVVFYIFFAFRGYIFSDWTNYYPFFYECSIQDITNYKFGDVEPGFTLLNLLCRSIFEDFHFFVFICTTINLFLLIRFLRNRVSNIPLALMLFFCFEGVMIMTNLMRNSISILLFLNAITYLVKRQPVQYYALCLLALLFHYSAFLYFFVYLFFHIRFSKWIYLAIFVGCNVIFIIHFSVFQLIISAIGFDTSVIEKLDIYTAEASKNTIFSIGYLERLATGLLIFCYYEKLQNMREENAVYINAILFYFAFFFLFSEFDIFSKRLALLFVFGYWILWYDLIKCFSIESNRFLFQLFIGCYCILKIAGINYPDAEYDNVLWGIKSYEERLYLYNKNFKEN